LNSNVFFFKTVVEFTHVVSSTTERRRDAHIKYDVLEFTVIESEASYHRLLMCFFSTVLFQYKITFWQHVYYYLWSFAMECNVSFL